MIVTTSADTQKGPGYAIFTLQPDDASSPLPTETAGLTFSIRNSSGASLGKGKWVQGKATFAAESVENKDGTLLVGFGPAVVDHLDPMETFQLCLTASGGVEHYGTFFLENVLPSSARVKDIPDQTPPPKPVTPPPPPEPVIPAFPQPEPEPEPIVAPEPPPVVAPAPVAVEPPVRPSTSQPQKKSGMGILIALLLVALIGGGGAYYWFVMRGDSAPVSGPETVDGIRKFLAGNPDVDALNKRFSTATWNDANADARFLLAEELANRGNAEAMAVVGTFYDPSHTAPSGSIVKDAEQAFNNYSAAKKAGHPGMDERLDSLKKWLEKQAADGSADARRLLDSWK